MSIIKVRNVVSGLAALASILIVATTVHAAPAQGGGNGMGMGIGVGAPGANGGGRAPGELPPGLAKRDQLPPGLAKRDTLPPGLTNQPQVNPGQPPVTPPTP